VLRDVFPALIFAGIAIQCSTIRLSAAEPVKAQLTRPEQRSAAPDIKLKDRHGRVVDLQSLRGEVVLLDFWATWCGGCKQELPWFQEFHTKYRARKFSVVAISMDSDGRQVVQPFVERLGLHFAILLDDGDASKRYNVQSMPAAFLIDRDGRVAARYVGLVDRTNLEDNIKSVLAERRRK
jgi:peroxiredoxin